MFVSLPVTSLPPPAPPSPSPPPAHACQIYVRFAAVWPSFFFLFRAEGVCPLGTNGRTMNNTPHTITVTITSSPALMMPAPVESILAPFIPPNQSSLMPTLTMSMSMSIVSTLCCIWNLLAKFVVETPHTIYVCICVYICSYYKAFTLCSILLFRTQDLLTKAVIISITNNLY